MENENQPQKKKWYKKKKYWALIIGGGFVLIVVLALISGKGMPMLKDVPSKVNQSALSLKGWHVESGSNVKVYLNGDVAMETQADGNGEFNVELNLIEGKNTLYAVATYKGKLVKGAEEEITYINQEKIDAQNKADADAKAVADAAQQKAVDDAKTTADAATQQAELDAKNKADADAQAAADAAKQKAADANAIPQNPPASPSEQDQIKQIVSKLLSGKNDNGEDYVRNIDVIEQDGGGWGVMTEYNAGQVISMDSKKGDIETKMADIYTALYTSGKDIRTASVAAYLPSQDKYGNTGDKMVYKTMLFKAEADKVNWKADKDTLELVILPKVWTTTILDQAFQK